MNRFHDPDVSFTVMRRRLGDQLLDCLFWYGRLVESHGWHVLWEDAFPTQAAYHSAVYRLSKAGLLVSTRTGRFAQLALTDVGKSRLNVLHQPEKMWRRKWPGYWYMLVYDVPESSRSYRNVLRGFLKEQHLGCLQKSIYITPNDVRPEFSDLCEAIEVDKYAYLFEARTVLGLDPMEVVRDAWDWPRINAGHAWYYRTYEKQLMRVTHDRLDVPALRTLAREEMSAYVTVMRADPLLPSSLLGKDHLGGAVLGLHSSLTKAIAASLK